MFSTPQRPMTPSRCVLLRKVSSGAAGVVYSAYDPELDRRVAVKVLRPGGSVHLSTLKPRERFVREARVGAKFSHPNVIAVHDVGTINAAEDPLAAQQIEGEAPASSSGVFIIMELIDGDNLQGWLHEEPRSWREILRVFLAAGRGLAAAHEAGIVHRDFKPSNVLLGSSADGRVKDTDIKVADFGLAVRRTEAERFDSIESKDSVDATASL